MTEQQATPTTAQDHEQLLKVITFKNQLGAQLEKLYRELITFVQNLPTNPTMKTRAIGYFDDGILWINESIKIADLKIEPVVTPESEPISKAS